ncbi:MAG: AsnC family transcriptional regulator [Candidatus Aenigmarchaeota archaeon ex4484_224]|nr:MAG: AsnC family transcriptional regulator [Candidatus Aenigmarchaeota archaeon ex4484_224]
MVLAYILMQIQPGKEKKIIDKLSKIKEVKETHLLYGEYDLIAKVEFEDMKKLNEFVMNVLRKQNGVKVTSTMICV